MDGKCDDEIEDKWRELKGKGKIEDLIIKNEKKDKV